MSAPQLPVFSWESIERSQRQLGLKRHALPGRARVAVARLRRSPIWPIAPYLAAAFLILDGWLAKFANEVKK